jgi:thiol-disulfide isomerase/thioredoxin
LWIKDGGAADRWQQWLTREVRTIRDASPSWTKVDRTLPEFELGELSGRTWSMPDFKGKRTLVNMWATWCGPCRTELPHLQKLYEQLKDRKDVQVVTWNVDEDRSAVAPYVKEEGFTFPVLLARELVDKLGIHGYPTSWIIEPDGSVREEQLGFTGEPNAWVNQVLLKLAPK